jgi:hypothetical protein
MAGLHTLPRWAEVSVKEELEAPWMAMPAAYHW